MQSPRTPKTTPKSRKRKRRKDDRGFDEVPLFAVAAQPGKDRYASHADENLSLPPLASHRINLAVLSQRHNLFIVASGPSLLLFELTGPHHEAPGDTQCSFELPATRPNLRGHISVNDPHYVNNIIVGDLGEDEIILCACDDGDVIGYWTQELVRFVEDYRLRQRELHRKHRAQKKAEKEDARSYWDSEKRNEDPLERACRLARETEDREAELERHMGPPPRQFFHENVELSAWGLAIHKDARLIAASANTRVITVWAPALTKSSTIPKKDRKYDELLRRPRKDGPDRSFRRDICSHRLTIPRDMGVMRLDSRVLTTLSSQRGFDQRRFLCAHQHNIPSIAFCNTPEDTSGRYLASTDVVGACVVWDVDRGIPVRIMKFPEHEYEPGQYPTGFDRTGWGTMFFDKRSFVPTTSIVEAMGLCSSVTGTTTTVGPEPSGPSLRKRNLELFDISTSRSMIRKTSSWCGNKTSKPSDPNTMLWSTSDTHPAAVPDSSDDEIENQYVGLRNSAIDMNATFRSNLIGGIPQRESHTIPTTIRCVDGKQLDLRVHTDRWPLFTLESLHAAHGHHSELACPFIPSFDEMPDSPMMLLNTHTVHLFQSSSLLNPPNGQPENLKLMDTFYGSEPGISIPEQWRIPEIVDPDDGCDPGPSVYCDDPLAQEVPDELAEQMAHVHDRLCMMAQIRDLGVVLIGSPKGRVAIFTLHQLHSDRSNPVMFDEESTYTMRLDHILPFSDQEKKHQRPLQPLCGLSCGPIFRADGSIAPHRWRIMLLYKDHTLLTYEVWRPGHAPTSFC